MKGYEMTTWIYHDGGRSSAGFKGGANDCVVRAIAIVTRRPYREVYNEVARYEQAVTGTKSARNGVSKKAYKKYLTDQGFKWTPTMRIGSGTTVHLKADELPGGSVIVEVSRHMVAVVEGIIRDTHDPSRAGTRAVYGYWLAPERKK